MIQPGFNPHWLFVSLGANNPVEFPDKVGEEDTEGIFTTGDRFAGLRQPGAPEFVKACLAQYGGAETDIDTTSAEAYSVGTLIEQVAETAEKLDAAGKDERHHEEQGRVSDQEEIVTTTPLPTAPGHTAVDCETRVYFDRLRAYRLFRARAAWRHRGWARSCSSTSTTSAMSSAR